MFSFTKATKESRDSCSVFISFSDLRYAPNAFSKVSLSEIKSSGSSYKSHICAYHTTGHSIILCVSGMWTFKILYDDETVSQIQIATLCKDHRNNEVLNKIMKKKIVSLINL